jgi:hypothetical protein
LATAYASTAVRLPVEAIFALVSVDLQSRVKDRTAIARVKKNTPILQRMELVVLI